MVKLKKPLSSLSASGTLGNKITYINIGVNSCAKFYRKPPPSKTASQESMREVFKAACELAKDLSPEEKIHYAGLKPNSAACPWWNNFIGEYIKDHWPVSADVNSFTRKREPSVADLQAVHSFVRVKDDFTVTDAGINNLDIYTVPEGFIFHQQLLSCVSNSADPSSIAFLLRLSEVDYVYYSEAYGGAWEQHTCVFPVDYDADEIVRVQFAGCEIDNVLYWNLFGYLTNKY